MSEIDLDELERLEKAALPRPWRQGATTHWLVDAEGYEVAEFHHGHEQVFVVALRNAAPALFARLRRHEVALKTILERISACPGCSEDLGPTRCVRRPDCPLEIARTALEGAKTR